MNGLIALGAGIAALTGIGGGIKIKQIKQIKCMVRSVATNR